MLTKADDYPIHQTPEPIAYAGTDRNFYDRYFFNGYNPDGSVYFAMAFGVYPHLNIMDAAFSVILGDTQHSLHASRIMFMERMNLTVGPISIEVIEPLAKLRIRVEDEENDIHVDLVFSCRSAPIEEPRFHFRRGPRTLFDYTRLTQNGTWEGSLEVKGEKVEVGPDRFLGTRDRSWGVRPIGAGDAQPLAPAEPPQFYWIWVPLNFEDRSTFYHINADASGAPWNESGTVMMNGGEAEARAAASASTLTFKPGTRHASQAEVRMSDADGGVSTISLEIEKNFYMRGIGYTHPEWGHGAFKGELATAYECWNLNEVDESAFDSLHVQALAQATLTLPDGKVLKGRGIVEQLIIGPHAPSGFVDLLDGAK